MADSDRPANADSNTGGDTPRDVKSREGAPNAPILTRPQEEGLVDGENVTLEWEPIEGADLYVVEVAEDAPFHKVLVQEETDGTSLSLPDALPTDGALYYWRVMARRDGEWSHGDRIESFMSVTAERAHAGEDDETPDREEDYGPAAELFTSAGTAAAAEATGDEKRFAREREMGVAHEGVEAGQIMGFAGVVIVAIVLIVCVLFFWITSVAQSTRDLRADASVYTELEASETRATEQLSQYELLSDRDSTYRIPIGEAMRLVAEEARQRRPATGNAAPADSLDYEVPLDPLAPRADSGGASVPRAAAPEGPAGSASN